MKSVHAGTLRNPRNFRSSLSWRSPPPSEVIRERRFDPSSDPFGTAYDHGPSELLGASKILMHNEAESRSAGFLYMKNTLRGLGAEHPFLFEKGAQLESSGIDHDDCP